MLMVLFRPAVCENRHNSRRRLYYASPEKNEEITLIHKPANDALTIRCLLLYNILVLLGKNIFI